MSTPTETLSGCAYMNEPSDASVSASTQGGATVPQPVRLRVACHRHSPDDLLRCDLQQFKAHLVVECTHLGVFGRHVWPVGRSHGLRLDSANGRRFADVLRQPRRRQCTQLESACADDDSADQDSADSDSARQRAASRAAHAAKADADRRPLDRVPSLSSRFRSRTSPPRPASTPTACSGSPQC